jgi:hypothetical protein
MAVDQWARSWGATDRLIKQQRRAPPNWWRADLERHWDHGKKRVGGSGTGTTIESDQDATQHNALRTMMTTTMKGVVNHNKEDPPKGGKYTRSAKARRRDWHFPRRYIMRQSRFMMMTVFLLMAKATVVTVTTLLSTIVGGFVVIGSGDDGNHPGIVITATMS